MGASPQQKAVEAAKASVKNAQRRQRQVKQSIRNKVKAYKQKAVAQLETIEGASGATLPEYISETKSQFGPVTPIQPTQQKYETMLRTFDPGLIGSSSEQQLQNALMQSAQRYAQDLSNVSRGISAQLYGTLNEPAKQFQQLASSAATNIQLDPIAMNLATKPQTIRSDVASMADLYRYNI